MRRREFIAGLGAAAAWSPAARAQQPKMPVIGFLNTSTLTESRRRANIDPFLQGLAQMGFVEGRNVTIEYRSAEDRDDQLAALAVDLVRREVAVIVTMSTTQTARAAQAATKQIPIIFYSGGDPVEFGLVASLGRPGGNITGFTVFATELTAKRIELLHELVPAASSIAWLFNPTNPTRETKEVQNAADVLGLDLLMVGTSHQREFETAFATLVQRRVGALLVGADPLFNTYRDQIIALAARHAIPALYLWREGVADGGLVSFGPSIPDAARQVGVYAGRILKGEKPADLPVQQPSKIELVINLKTAKALGLTIPLPLLGRADEVIE